METQHTEQRTGIFSSIKQAVGLGGKKDDEQHEITTSHANPAYEEEEKTAPQVMTPRREDEHMAPTAPTAERGAPVQAQRLLKPQEVEAGVERPAYSMSEEERTALPGSTSMEPESKSPRSHALTIGEEAGSPADHAKERLLAAGATPIGGASLKEKEKESEVGRPPSPIQGERIKVQRMGGGAPSEGRAGMKEVDVRPDHEVALVSGAEVLEMGAMKHALIAEEKEQALEKKQHEIEELRKEAQHLEEESASLISEARKEQSRVDKAVVFKERVQHTEWKGYSEAEQAEKRRRSIVEEAREPARTAEELDAEVIQERQLASDIRFHAEVLERRAKALVQESKDMAGLSVDKLREAESVSYQLQKAKTELEQMKHKIKILETKGLPEYITTCQKEIGRLSHRIRQLEEEIEWAHLEMGKSRSEGDDWNRIITTRQSKIAHMILRLTQLKEDAELARHRSKAAAVEVEEPASLAQQKYSEVEEHLRLADELERQAKDAQGRALDIVVGATEPTRERQVHLREAAAAEVGIKRAQAQADVVIQKLQRKLYEAQVSAENAEKLCKQAEELEKEVEMEKKQIEAERDMEETFLEQQGRAPEVETISI